MAIIKRNIVAGGNQAKISSSVWQRRHGISGMALAAASLALAAASAAAGSGAQRQRKPWQRGVIISAVGKPYQRRNGNSESAA
jgi:hypothetical protein